MSLLCPEAERTIVCEQLCLCALYYMHITYVPYRGSCMGHVVGANVPVERLFPC